MSQITDVKRKLENAQALHKMYLEDGAVDTAAELVKDIDALQKEYEILKANAEPEKSGSRKYSPNGLPDIDKQIEHVKSLLETNFGAGSVMLEGMYQSLIELKLIKGAFPGGIDFEVSLTPPQEAMKSMSKHYDLEAQFEFIQKLIEATVQSKDALDKELMKMYKGISDNLQVAYWTGKAAADYLLELPSNQPQPVTEERKMSIDSTYIEIQKSDNPDFALGQFKAFLTDEPENVAYGTTESWAVINLYKRRETKKQEELFPKEVING